MDFILYKGDDVGIAGRVDFSEEDTSQSLDDFDIVLMLSTAVQGRKILTYTEADKGDVQIERKEGNQFAINISHTLTAQLSQGELVVSVALINKASGIVSQAQQKTILVSETRLIGVL